jgi:hypothetical protein
MGEKESSLTFKQGNLAMGIVILAFSAAFYYFSYHFAGYEIEKVPHDVGRHSCRGFCWEHWPLSRCP